MFFKKGIPQNVPKQPTQGTGQANPIPGQPPGQIAITQEQMILIQQLTSSPAFNTLREQALNNPESLPQLLQMLQQNYPSLFALFNQNPQLLIAILAGNFNFVNPQNQDELGDDQGDHIDDGPVGEDLTPEDHQAIQNVI